MWGEREGYQLSLSLYHILRICFDIILSSNFIDKGRKTYAEVKKKLKKLDFVHGEYTLYRGL